MVSADNVTHAGNRDSRATSISVVIPLYNKQTTICRALDGILAQDERPDEIIVVDDGSEDEGPELVEARYSRDVSLIRQTNQGVSAARNRGAWAATSQYVAFLDADDYWRPKVLGKFRELIGRWSHCVLY